jgi:drug/metabolite transporter (DMT)-like permease
MLDSALWVAILSGLGGMFGWGLADLFAKKTSDSIGEVSVLTLSHLLGTGSVVIGVLLYVFYTGAPVYVPTTTEILYLPLFGAVQACVYFLLYRAMRIGKASVVSPIFSAYSILIVLFAALIFGEVVSPVMYILLACIMAGMLCLSADAHSVGRGLLTFSEKGLPEVLASTVLAALGLLFWDRFVSGGDWLALTLYAYMFRTLAICIGVYVLGGRVRYTHARSMWLYLVCIGTCEIGAYLAVSWGYGATTYTAVVAILSGVFAIPTLVGAQLWLHEKITARQMVGIAVLLVSAFFVCLVSGASH